MFRQRQKKEYPPGTFIPTPARLCAIIQLCLAFSALFWIASEPFVGKIFTLKSRLLFYQDAMGIQSPAGRTSPEKTARLERNAARFLALPKEIKEPLIRQYALIQKQLQESFWSKLEEMFRLFSGKISPFELAWIFFSVAISILLLKKVEGASQAIWILPLITALYAADTTWHAHLHSPFSESTLFPSEQELVENDLGEPLRESPFEQQEQLMHAWKHYLIREWTKEPPSNDETMFERQAEEGEFRFTLARLTLRTEYDRASIKEARQQPPAYWQLLLYFFWNAYFAYTAWRYTLPSLLLEENVHRVSQ